METEATDAPPPAGARACGQVGTLDVDIYVDDAAMRESVGYAFSARDKLVLGVLVGNLHRWQGRLHTLVHAFIPARKAVSTSASCKFTREAWEDVKQIRADRFPDQRIVGWMQSLPGFGVVVTEMSASLHQSYFDLPHQVLLTVDPVSDDVGFFGWKAGKLERSGFHAFSSNRGSGSSSSIPLPQLARAPSPPTAVPVPAAVPAAAPATTPARRTFLELLTEHGMPSLHRQLHAADLLGKHTWSLDLKEGKITLGAHVFPVQVLGTAADADQTWLWGWANTASGIPESALKSARVMQRLGEQHGIKELTDALVPVARLDPGALTLVAAGVCSAAFFYRAAYEGGAAYLLIPAPGLGLAPADPARASTVITSFIADHAVNHRESIRHFAKYMKFMVVESGPRLVVRSAAGALSLEFDALDRMTRMTLEAPR